MIAARRTRTAAEWPLARAKNVLDISSKTAQPDAGLDRNVTAGGWLYADRANCVEGEAMMHRGKTASSHESRANVRLSKAGTVAKFGILAFPALLGQCNVIDFGGADSTTAGELGELEQQ